MAQKGELIEELSRTINEAFMHLDIVNSTHRQRLEKLRFYLKHELSIDMMNSFLAEAEKILKFYSKI